MAELNEVAADVVEEIAENGVELAEALRGVSTRAAAAATSLGLLAGAFAGYFIAMKRLEDKYAAVAEDEIDSMREHFRKQLIARDEKPNLGDLGKKIEDLGYAVNKEEQSEEPAGPGEPNTPDVPPAVQNVFENNPPVERNKWDWDAEREARGRKNLYVLHVDEYGQDDAYETITLTYYQGDDVLCDAEDKVVDDQERVVGVENLDKFGHGSNDRDRQVGQDLRGGGAWPCPCGQPAAETAYRMG
jgi:hypothetical protein